MLGLSKNIFEKHRDELILAVADTKFVVFLCGPTLKKLSKPSARARNNIKKMLEAENFDVVLGEDDGLENTRIKTGINAQDNELAFICNHCNAVVLLADSVGAFCELGLFSWHYVHGFMAPSRTKHRTDCIVLINKRYKGHRTYINEGPGRSVKAFGELLFVNFGSFDPTPIVERFKERRAIFSVERRGRPRKAPK
jgi:hypothetical protein